jgi:RimJ/RimL family protein N-acetyltransferase
MDTTAPAARATSHLRVVLDARRGALIRPIDRSDALALSDLYRSLSPESSRRRFLGTAGPTTQPGMDAREIGLVAELVEPGPRDGTIIGHAALYPLTDESAEVSFVVADDFQSRGIGSALMREAIRRARVLGLSHLEAAMFVDNVTMRRVMQHAGCLVERDTIEGGVEEISIALAGGITPALAAA